MSASTGNTGGNTGGNAGSGQAAGNAGARQPVRGSSKAPFFEGAFEL